MNGISRSRYRKAEHVASCPLFGIEPQLLPCKKTEQYPELAWLCLRRSFVHCHAPREWEIDRSDEAYNYPYFLYGKEMDGLMESL